MSSVQVQPASSGAWTFTQGFLLGQATFILLCLLFVRYVVFSPAESQNPEDWKKLRAERAKKTLLSTTAVPPPPTSHLLGTTGYEMATHPAESADWINVLGAQILQGYRNDLLSSAGEEGARQHFQRWLNPAGVKMSWLDPIEVTSISLGKSYPLLSNARIRPADGLGNVRCEVDIDFADSVSMNISTSVLINFPRPRFAVLPVAIGVELQSVGGTLSVQISEAKLHKDNRQHVHVSLQPDFHLNLKTTSLLGSRAKLQDIPKLEQLLVGRLRAVIQDRLVYPKYLTFGLPTLLRKANQESVASQVIPTETDIRAVALDAMSRGISRLGQDLASRVQAMGPTDNSSTVGEDVDANASTADVSEASSPVEVEIPTLEPSRQLPLPSSAHGVSSAISNENVPLEVGTSPTDVKTPTPDLRHRALPRPLEGRKGTLNSRSS